MTRQLIGACHARPAASLCVQAARRPRLLNRPQRAATTPSRLCSVRSKAATKAECPDVEAEAKATLAWTAEDWASAFKGAPSEYDYAIEDVEGTIPAELDGTVYLAGPANFKRGTTEYSHWLDGDGAVVALSFRGGRAHVRMRFVRTDAFRREAEEDQVLYRGTFGTNKEGGWQANFLDVSSKNTANTAVIAWGGKLLVLWEAGLPHLLDKGTLDTISTFDFRHAACRPLKNGVAPSSTGIPQIDDMLGDMFGDAVGAHTRVDPRTQRLVVWSWKSILTPLKEPTIAMEFREFDESFEQVGDVVKHNIPGACLNPHDIVLTDDHYIFFQPPLNLNPLPFLLGVKGAAQCISYDSTQNMYIHMVPRRRDVGAAKILETEGGFPIHHAVAYVKDRKTQLVTSGWISDKARTQLHNTAEKGILGSWESLSKGDFSEVPESSIFQYTIDMVTDKVSKEMLHKAQVDHPHTNPRFSQREARYIYFCASNPLLQGTHA